jgi:hypothetical protein
MIIAVVKSFVPVITLKPLTNCALPLAQNARWNYNGLSGEHRGITVFVLDSVPDFMRKASAMGSLLHLRFPGILASRLQPMGAYHCSGLVGPL